MEVSPELLARIRREFLEMPGLKITSDQACRLWSLKVPQCQDALDALIAEGFLLQTPSGAFIAVPSATRVVKASISEHVRVSRCPHCQLLNSVPAADSLRTRPGPMTFRCSACSRIVNLGPASAKVSW